MKRIMKLSLLLLCLTGSSPYVHAQEHTGNGQQQQAQRPKVKKIKIVRGKLAEELYHSLSAMNKISDLSNICSDPGDPKYRSLKITNSLVKNKVLNVAGGMEFLTAVGFKIGIDRNDFKVIQLLDDDKEVIGNLQIALHWLENTVVTCKAFARSKVPPASAPLAEDDDRVICADCTISVRLPTGASVLGGFMRGDRLSDVRSFAACQFTDDR